MQLLPAKVGFYLWSFLRWGLTAADSAISPATLDFAAGLQGLTPDFNLITPDLRRPGWTDGPGEATVSTGDRVTDSE
jgi:hypothetical protein